MARLAFSVCFAGFLAVSRAGSPVAPERTGLASATATVSLSERGEVNMEKSVFKRASSADSSILASMLTNGGTKTLQGRPTFLRAEGVPMTCDIPQCSRSSSCQGAECCNTQMFEALSAITGWMDSNSVQYTVLFGTLLGGYRDKDVIPWTGDLDIGILSKDVHKIIEQKDIPWHFGFDDFFAIPRGCEYHHPGFPGNYSEFTMSEGGWCKGGDFGAHPGTCTYYVDLYVIDDPLHGGRIAENCVKKSLDSSGNLRTSTVEIRGQQFAAPISPEDCLVDKYGASWAIPDAKESFNR